MATRVCLISALALVLTCAPTALPRSESGSPGTVASIASDDVITLREGGQQPSIVVRKMRTAEIVRTLPDGELLPDGTTIITVEESSSATTLRAVDRRTGVTLGSRVLPGSWTLRPNGYGRGSASPNGLFIVLRGSSYNFTDESGKWTAKTTFAVVDTIFKGQPRVVELEGRFTFEGISNDGRSLYLGDAVVPQQLPTPARLGVYDLRSRSFAEVTGGAVPDLMTNFSIASVSFGAFTFAMYAGREPKIVRRDLDARTIHVMALPGDQVANGEGMLLWSLVATRDGRTLYAVNPAVGVVDEIDASSMQLRRTARLTQARSEQSPLDVVLGALHPIAYAKRGFITGAVLTPDGAALYALGETGVWAIDTASLEGRLLTKDGEYASILLSPDGVRLYVLGFQDGVVRALDRPSANVVGAMKRFAYASDILAVDAGN